MRALLTSTTGATFVGALLSANLALAQPASTTGASAEPEPAQGVNFAVGLGIGVAPDYEGSDDYAPVPLWNLSVNNIYHPKTFIQVLGPRLLSNLLPDDHWRFGVVAQFIKERDDVDDNAVDDLDSVDPALMVGLVGGYDFLADPQHDVIVEAEARQDIANDNGFLGTLRGRYGGRLSPSMRVDTFIQSTWANDDYMSSYFGIDGGDAARSGLDQFSADEGFKDVGLGGSVTYRFLEHWSVTGLANYTRLLNDAADSPVVDDRGDENQFVTGALINYRF